MLTTSWRLMATSVSRRRGILEGSEGANRRITFLGVVLTKQKLIEGYRHELGRSGSTNSSSYLTVDVISGM